MIWFLIVPVVFIFAIKDLWFDTDTPYMHSFLDLFMCLLGAFLFSLLTGIACAGFAFLIGFAFDTYPVKVSDDVLVAIRDKDGVTGQFFLGSGFIQGDQYYFYYRQLPDGGFKPDKVYVGSGVRVYEEDRQDAHLITFEWKLIKEWAYLIAIPHDTSGYSYDFHVPKGTIRRGFIM